MANRMIAPLYCDGCGAGLPINLRCEYCGLQHQKVQRYAGPEIPEQFQKRNNVVYDLHIGTYATATTFVTTCSTSYDGRFYYEEK